MAFYAAFYRGTRPGIPGIYNRLVRARGYGPYSHMELVFSDGLSASASFEDGGARYKKINYHVNDPNWDLVELPLEWELGARAYFDKLVAAKTQYSLRGNIHLTIGFISPSKDRVFCSEAGMAALKFDQAWRFEPNAAYVATLRAAEIHRHATVTLAA